MKIYKQRKDHIYVSVMSVWGGGLYAYKPTKFKMHFAVLKKPKLKRLKKRDPH